MKNSIETVHFNKNFDLKLHFKTVYLTREQRESYTIHPLFVQKANIPLKSYGTKSLSWSPLKTLFHVLYNF